jgi:glycosyltransferase involved in cell wall biosynthesis
MIDLTAIILTMNESKNIKECIDSIKNLASHIIVVDSGSIDDTIEIAKENGAEVFFNKYENYAQQFNWALENTNITTKWVMRIDADERITKELAEEIIINSEKYYNDESVNGMVLHLRVYFLGRWIKHGGVYPFRKLMVFKKGVGRMENKKKDAHTILDKGTSVELKNDALHYDFKDLDYWVKKHNWGATNEMQDFFEINPGTSNNALKNQKISKRRRGRTFYYKCPMFLRAHWLFIYRYFLRAGFLDGKEGLIFHFLQAYWYRFLVDAKIFEQQKMGGELKSAGALKG